jgi:hypothetical protein
MSILFVHFYALDAAFWTYCQCIDSAQATATVSKTPASSASRIGNTDWGKIYADAAITLCFLASSSHWTVGRLTLSVAVALTLMSFLFSMQSLQVDGYFQV